MQSPTRVVVLGGGVSGLTTALVLAEKGQYEVTVFGQHLPGDEALEYTSPWAGANYLPVSTKGTRQAKWDEETLQYLRNLAETDPDAGVDIQDAFLWNRRKDLDKSAKDWATELSSERPWFADIVDGFRVLDRAEMPDDCDYGTTFKTPCINPIVYLHWLVRQLLQRDVQIVRGSVKHIKDARHVHASGKFADLIVNCTGIQAYSLHGVSDPDIYPAKGQICVVRNSCRGLVTTSGTDDADDEVFYVQPRLNGGTVIGGTYQKGNWSGEIDEDMTERMLQRAIRYCPELTNGAGPEALEILRITVGLRPARTGGPRVEKQQVAGVWVVHNYGHGGYGYQCSYGCALEAAGLVDEIVGHKQEVEPPS